MEDMLQRELHIEIAHELLKEYAPNISREEVESIYEKCNGNPFNAPVLFQLLQIANQP